MNAMTQGMGATPSTPDEVLLVHHKNRLTQLNLQRDEVRQELIAAEHAVAERENRFRRDMIALKDREGRARRAFDRVNAEDAEAYAEIQRLEAKLRAERVRR